MTVTRKLKIAILRRFKKTLITLRHVNSTVMQNLSKFKHVLATINHIIINLKQNTKHERLKSEAKNLYNVMDFKNNRVI